MGEKDSPRPPAVKGGGARRPESLGIVSCASVSYSGMSATFNSTLNRTVVRSIVIGAIQIAAAPRLRTLDWC